MFLEGVTRIFCEHKRKKGWLSVQEAMSKQGYPGQKVRTAPRPPPAPRLAPPAPRPRTMPVFGVQSTATPAPRARH